MKRHRTLDRSSIVSVLGLGVVIGMIPACESLPGSSGQQGAVAGGVGGAAVGAAVAKEHRVLGAVIGGVAGAAGGYLIGANWDKITGNEREQAAQSAQRAQTTPATADQARNASTADINFDGFVTLDEVIAMKNAGFSEDEMLRRLRATDQIFELTSDQEQRLIDQGVSRSVVSEMRSINQDRREELLRQQGTVSEQDVIGRPPVR
jgi:hypothetical protein